MNNLNISPYQETSVLAACSSILIDTCSILEGNAFVTCMRKIIPTLQPSQHILIPHAVRKELHFQGRSSESTCRAQALRSEEEITALAQAGILSYIGDPNAYEHTDHFLIRYAATHCFDEKLLIITQDGDLSRDLLSISRVTNQLGAPIYVRNLDENGNLIQKYEANLDSIARQSVQTILQRFGL